MKNSILKIEFPKKVSVPNTSKIKKIIIWLGQQVESYLFWYVKHTFYLIAFFLFWFSLTNLGLKYLCISGITDFIGYEDK